MRSTGQRFNRITGRYLIVYDNVSGSITFNLAGATQEGRQKNYLKLIDEITKNGSSSYNQDKDIYQDIEIGKGYFAIKKLLTDEKTLYFVYYVNGDLELELGVLPNENGFSRKVYDEYEKYSDAYKQSFLKLNVIRFNQWGAETIILGFRFLSLSLHDYGFSNIEYNEVINAGASIDSLESLRYFLLAHAVSYELMEALAQNVSSIN